MWLAALKCGVGMEMCRVFAALVVGSTNRGEESGRSYTGPAHDLWLLPRAELMRKMHVKSL